MKRMDRRKFMLLASVGSTGAVLTACGNDPDDVDLNPTRIPVEGAPPTLAPNATPGGGATENEDAGGGEEGGDANVVELEAQDPFNWSTNELEAAPGQVIRVTNTGLSEHDIAIDELSIHEALPNGEPVDITLPEDVAVGDTYTYYCTIPGHRESGMEGTLTIVEASAEAAPAEEEGDAAAGAGEPVVLEAQDPFNWSTNELEAAPGQVIQVTNTGLSEHDFVIDELEIAEPLPNGEPVEVTIPEDVAAGDTYTYYCSIPGHRESGMEGTLTIVEAGGGAAAPAEDEAESEEATPEEEADAAASPAAAAEASPAASPAAAAGGSAVEVAAVDLGFEPTELSMAADTDVTITFTNNGVLQHDFVIEDTDFKTELIDGGGSAELVVNLPAGEYTYFCSVQGHREAGMEGTLTVG